jgi:hypothetical protein
VRKYWVLLLVALGLGAIVVFRQRIGEIGTYLLPHTISVVSETDDVVVASTDVKLIRAALDQVEFYSTNQITQYAPSTAQIGRVSVRNLRVVLTTDEQALGKTYSTGEQTPFQSWGVLYTPTSGDNVYDVTILLHVTPAIVEREDAETLARRYQGILLRAVWDLSHPQKPEYAGLERFEGMKEYASLYRDEQWWTISK